MKAALTAALAALAIASPAVAYEFDTEHQQLETTIEHLMEVTVDHPDCFKGRYAGWISNQGIVACSVNSDSFEDFQDTLRHEGWHLAQRCHAYTSNEQGYKTIWPWAIEQGYAEFGRIVRQYPIEQQDFEAEAWFVASLSDAQFVDDTIRHYCSFAF